ncbi:hypothetical protein IFR04_011256 [Cadophora malorum]|uniref:Vacuolar ATPase assembly protein VMA22 n=1 Tax=Cadophora malorum TaxID=108018 RepID=A0A8H7W530_9HELO|nr:hypothetical protein IFR04_011256 [Cadophora malorum]
MAADSQAFSDEIDSLLVRYLTLLDEYTSLRGSLGSLQSSIYADIARANFQAERGVSYGREAYDRRAMTPGRVCRVTGDAEDGTVGFEVQKVRAVDSAATEDGPGNKAEEKVKEGQDGNDSNETEDIAEGMEKVNIQTESSQEKSPEIDDPSPPKSTSPSQNKPLDPIRMFGFSIPSALRSAQSSSIQLVETSIPRLASINLQMRALEIQIRRARKYRTKALAAESSAGGMKAGAKEGVAV